MDNSKLYESTISRAASRVRGTRLQKLYMLCENQKTISTRKLEALLDELAESDRLDGIHFRKLADKISKNNQVNP